MNMVTKSNIPHKTHSQTNKDILQPTAAAQAAKMTVGEIKTERYG